MFLAPLCKTARVGPLPMLRCHDRTSQAIPALSLQGIACIEMTGTVSADPPSGTWSHEERH